MNKTIIGIILIIIGAIGFVIIYSVRPPSGFGEALTMMGQGRQIFIREPYYQIFFTISGLLTLFGIILTAVGLMQGKK
jgi:Trk-type K+ transport system membrane component